MDDLSISIYKRNKALEHYYLQCIKNYYSLIGPSAVFISESNIKKKEKFEYMPTNSQMKQTIESAYLLSDRIEELDIEIND